MHKYIKGLYRNTLIRMRKLTQNKNKNKHIITVSEDYEHISYEINLETMEIDR